MAVVKKLALAEADIIHAAEWYDEQEPGLGERFVLAADSTIGSLATDALLYRVRFADVRRVGVRRFWKHGVFYVIRESDVVVFSVFHGSRNPKWLRGMRQEVFR